MRTLLIAVTFVAGCASTTPREQHVAKNYPTRSAAPRDSIEQERTGQTLNRAPDSMPRTDQPVGPLRDIPPIAPIP